MNSKNIILLAFTLAINYPVLLFAKAPTHAVSEKQAQSEGKTLGTLIILNKNEIAAGNLAEQKTSNKAVKNFAALMIKDHSKNLHKAESLSNKLDVKPIKGKVALKLKNKGQKELATLNKLQGSSFDKVYMNDMVKGHKEALGLINNLIQDSSNPIVKKYLEMTRKHVEYHLKKAIAIQASLQ